MIQITKWLNEDDRIYANGQYISTRKWLEQEKVVVEKKSKKEAFIKEGPDNTLALFRERIK